MALPKLFNLITWHNNTTPAINEDNLNAMSQAIDDIDNRVIGLAGTIMEDVPQIQEDIEELEEDFALIDEKIADATSEANRATTKANEAAASVISAGNKALISEGYAKGTQNGTPVGPSSPYYHNNAEYFKEQARSFTPEGYQDLVDDVAEAQEAITDIEGEKVSSNDAYVLRQCKGNSVDLGLVGGSVAWNQLVQNGNFADTSGWSKDSNTSLSVSGNEVTVTITSGSAAVFYRTLKTNNTHKYFITADIKSANSTSQSFVALGDAVTSKVYFNPTTSYKKVASVVLGESTTNLIFFYLYGSVGNTFNVKNVMTMDLTQLFGSTIADYIYSLEQATAGAGVAWFRQYFSNAYYAYNTGAIKSVNPSSRKVVGKNLLKITANSSTVNGVTYTINPDGTVIANGTATAQTTLDLTNGFVSFPSGTYIITGSVNSNARVYANPDHTQGYYDNGNGSNPFSVTSELVARIQVESGTTLNNTVFKPMIRFVDVEDDSFEPYQEIEYAFDTSKQLRGIPQLVNNKLSYDGDIYKADGSVTRKYGIVQITTDNMVSEYLDSTNNQWLASVVLSNSKKPANINTRGNCICNIMPVLTQNELFNSVGTAICIIHNSGNARFTIAGITTFADMQTWVTNHPLYLVYELATPTTESANAYQNPQRAFTDGTEEFIDAGVTASTRDVSIPVGNESEYNTSVVVPISQDYTDGAMEILKEIVASSSDFADFKTKVAAL